MTGSTLETTLTVDDRWVFDVRGMDCADCARTIEEGVGRLPGVTSASINFGAGTLYVVPGTGLTEAAVTRSVAAAGYTARSRTAAEAVAVEPWRKRHRRAIEVAFSALLWITAFVLDQVAGWTLASSSLFVVATLVAGYPMFRSAWYSLQNRRADMNVLMTIAVAGAIALGEFSEAASVAVLFAFGLLLQSMALERTRNAIRGLLDLAPVTARVLHDGQELIVPVATVQPGDTVLVKPGERIPIDGLVTEGESSVDQSAMTGESVPALVAPGIAVLAGTMNLDGALTLAATGTAGDSSLARVIELVEEAESSRAPAQAFVDRFAAIYTPVVLAVALLLATVVPLFVGDAREWIYRALVLLVVACPCALVISTPVALVSAIGSGSRRGVLFKGGAAIEALARVQTVAFDKTGTLTSGHPAVQAVTPLADLTGDELLAYAAAVEWQATHPIARSIIRAAQDRGLALPVASDARTIPGKGAVATINGNTVFAGSRRLFSGIPAEVESLLDQAEANGSTIVLVGNEAIQGLIEMSDPIRPSSAGTVRQLHQLGLQTVMLTGDHAVVAERIAAAAGVATWNAGLLPADKVAAVAELEMDGPVAMTGDGVNDAAALARASVGVVMGISGSDVAVEAADVVLMRDDLAQLPGAIRLARQTLDIIRQNIAASLLVKVVFLALTFVGITNLWLAVLADMGMSLLVTLNSLRLMRVARTPEPHLRQTMHAPELAAEGAQ